MRISTLEKLNELIESDNQIIVDHAAIPSSELVKKAESIRDHLQLATGELFRLKMEGQDRSDFAQLELPSSMLKDDNDRWVEVRLSNFVPLVAISDESKVLDACLCVIKSELEKVGCIVVDQSVFINGSSESSLDDLQDISLNDLWYSLFDYE